MQRPYSCLYGPYGQVQTLSMERLPEIILAKQCREHRAFNGAGDAERQRNDLLRTDGSHDK